MSRLSTNSLSGDQANSNARPVLLSDYMPTAFHLDNLTSTVSSTASVLFNPLATRAVVKGEAVSIISELAPQILEQRLRPSYINGKNGVRMSKDNQIAATPFEKDNECTRSTTLDPNELLFNAEIPESQAPLSLIQGFKATYPELANGKESVKKKSSKLHKRKTKGLLTADGFATSDAISDTASADGDYKPLNQLIYDRDCVVREKDKLTIRERQAIAEINRIEADIIQLEQKRKSLEENLVRFSDRKGELAEKLEDLNEKISNFGHENNEVSEKRGHAVKGTTTALTSKQYDPGTCFKTLAAHCDTIKCLDLDKPDGTLVTASLDNTLRVWNMATCECLGILDGHDGTVNCLQVSGNRLFTGSSDMTIRQWNLSMIPPSVFPTEASSSSNTNSTISSSRTNILLEGEKENEEIPNGSRNSMDGDKKQMVSIGESAWIATLEGHSGEITCLHNDDQYLVSGSADKTMKQWDIETSQCILTLDILWAMSSSKVVHHNTAFSDIYWLEDGDFVGALQFWNCALASGTKDGALRLWDLRTGQAHRTLLGHTGPITCLQFDELQIVSGSLDKSIRIWDLRTGSILDTLSYDHAITDLQFDAHKIVAAAGTNDIKIYNRISLLHTSYAGHQRPVSCVRYRDSLMVSGGQDAVVKLWSL